MPKIAVTYQLGTKKFRSVVEAKNNDEARYLVMGKIVFLDFKKESSKADDILNLFDSFDKVKK